MSTFLSKDVLAGLEAAQKTDLKKKNRFRVEFNKKHYPVIRLTKSGFCVEAEKAPMIRGLVDLYDRDKHLKQCLILLQRKKMGLFILIISEIPPRKLLLQRTFFKKIKL